MEEYQYLHHVQNFLRSKKLCRGQEQDFREHDDKTMIVFRLAVTRWRAQGKRAATSRRGKARVGVTSGMGLVKLNLKGQAKKPRKSRRMELPTFQ